MAGPLDAWGSYSEIGKAEAAARAYEDMKKYSEYLETEQNWIAAYDREFSELHDAIDQAQGELGTLHTWLHGGLELSDEEKQDIQVKQDELTASLDELNKKLYEASSRDCSVYREKSIRTAAKLEERVELERSVYNKYSGGYGVDNDGLLQDAGKTIQGVPSFFD